MVYFKETTCCGMYELYNFDGVTKESIGEKLKTPPMCGLLIATTIERQVTAAKALKANGFEVVCEFKNPNSQNLVTLWYKTVRQPKSTKS